MRGCGRTLILILILILMLLLDTMRYPIR